MRLRYTARAEADLELILAYSRAEWGDETATHYLTGLEATCRSLSRVPHMGRLIDERYHRFRHERHLIYYSVSNRTVLIVRILHERMLPRRHL